MVRPMHPLGWAIVALLLAAPAAHAEVQVATERNVGAAENPSFSFRGIPAPVRANAAAGAVLAVAQGLPDPKSGGLGVLNDGALPRLADEPRANFFFYPGSAGGCFRMDLGRVVSVAQVNTYSWHPNSRGPQVYTLYASDGAGPGFSLKLKEATEPTALGWTFVARVDNRINQPSPGGGQYGVSITDSTGSLGDYRYLLFCCLATEEYDDSGNTFYSEVNVIEKQ